VSRALLVAVVEPEELRSQDEHGEADDEERDLGAEADRIGPAVPVEHFDEDERDAETDYVGDDEEPAHQPSAPPDALPHGRTRAASRVLERRGDMVERGHLTRARSFLRPVVWP
jgi:hypothetical protein